MAVATFGPTSEWAGKKITREGDVFVAQHHGEISPTAIMGNDRQGRQIWVTMAHAPGSARSRAGFNTQEDGRTSRVPARFPWMRRDLGRCSAAPREQASPLPVLNGGRRGECRQRAGRASRDRCRGAAATRDV
jgi:hypothetical protein